MKDLNGMNITFDFNKLNKQADLIVCDGPLLSHYSTDTGDQYLLYWVDADDECNRWLMIRTNLYALYNYVNKQTSLYNVLTHPEDEFVWVVDFDDNLKSKMVQTIPVDAIPEDCLPEMDAMYEFENEDPLLQGSIDTYEINLPEKDRSFFNELIQKMGWRANSINLGRKIAVL